MSEPNKTELIVALDIPDIQKARKTIEYLDGLPVFYKIGPALFISGGPDFVKELVDSGKRIFLDLKLHDIPITIGRTIRQACTLGVEMLSVHISGGREMILTALQVPEELGGTEKPMKILGVTVLTSFDEITWGEIVKAVSGSKPNKILQTHNSVMGLVDVGYDWGLRGVVCSALELKEVRARYPEVYTVVPGIRPEGSSRGDQKRVVTPTLACEAGAHAIVVGRPITDAPKPIAVVESILKELSDVHTVI